MKQAYKDRKIQLEGREEWFELQDYAALEALVDRARKEAELVIEPGSETHGAWRIVYRARRAKSLRLILDFDSNTHAAVPLTRAGKDAHPLRQHATLTRPEPKVSIDYR